MAQMDESAEHFRSFTKVLKTSIARYGHLVDDKEATREQIEAAFQAIQKGQVERLAALEHRFRLALIKHRHGPAVYSSFVHHVTQVRENILAARPYFRERQEVFTTQIARALEARNPVRLYGCRINYQFINFAMKLGVSKTYDAETKEWSDGEKVSWAPQSRPAQLARQIAEARWELVILNMPLAISRSRMFYSRTPKSHLSFMDLVQHAAEGLISAIDKFELPYTPVFRGVACNWMTGNFIEAYSETMLHFYPKDKRRIYRANKFRAKFPHGGYSVSELVTAVNQGLDGSARTTEDEIQDLVAASSTVSADTKAPGEEEDVPDNVARFEAPAELRPDIQVEQAEARTRMLQAAAHLSLFDRKLLRLKGMPVDISA